MEKPTQRIPKGRKAARGFDVTCVIGRVQFDDTGEDSPHVAAFKLIAQHDAEGEYSFPTQNGGTCHVAVQFEGGMPND